ncbi:hypothetical protein [Pontibacter rugosus]
MNAAVNVSVQDGWLPEYARNGENSFVLPIVDTSMSDERQDEQDYNNLMNLLENEIVPTYYHNRDRWMRITKQSMRDVVPHFESNRMAHEYYEQLFNS